MNGTKLSLKASSVMSVRVAEEQRGRREFIPLAQMRMARLKSTTLNIAGFRG